MVFSSRSLRSLRPELLGLALLLPMVVVLGWLLYRWPSTSNVSTPSPSASIVSSPTAQTSSLVGTTSTPTQENVATVVIAAPDITARTYPVPLVRAASAAQVMADARAQGLTYVTKDYGGTLGLFFESINGVANDATRQLYWHLYINGQRSPLGASGAQVSPGDSVEWRFEAAKGEGV